MSTRPSNAYSNFSEKGFDFAAFMPLNDAQQRAWLVLVAVNRKLVFEFKVPMIYAPVFGPDVGDVAVLEDVTDKVISLLGDDGVVPNDLVEQLKRAGINARLLKGE